MLDELRECFSDLADDGFEIFDWEFIHPLSDLSKIKITNDDIRIRLEIPIKKASNYDSTPPEDVMKILIKNNYTILGYLMCDNYIGDIQYERFHNMESLNRIYQLLDLKLTYISRRQLFNYETNWSYQIDMIFRKF
jgi:hypothetical protein